MAPLSDPARFRHAYPGGCSVPKRRGVILEQLTVRADSGHETQTSPLTTVRPASSAGAARARAGPAPDLLEAGSQHTPRGHTPVRPLRRLAGGRAPSDPRRSPPPRRREEHPTDGPRRRGPGRVSSAAFRRRRTRSPTSLAAGLFGIAAQGRDAEGRGRQPRRPGSGRASGDRPCRAAFLGRADVVRGPGVPPGQRFL